MIVEAVKKELKLGKLEVNLKPVTSSTRVPLLANGTIDLNAARRRTIPKAKSRSPTPTPIS